MANFAVLAPEFNSALIYIGAGSVPPLQAATHFTRPLVKSPSRAWAGTPSRSVGWCLMAKLGGSAQAWAGRAARREVKPGVTTQQINDIAYDLLVNKYGAEVDREDLSGCDSSEHACISGGPGNGGRKRRRVG